MGYLPKFLAILENLCWAVSIVQSWVAKEYYIIDIVAIWIIFLLINEQLKFTRSCQ